MSENANCRFVCEKCGKSLDEGSPATECDSNTIQPSCEHPLEHRTGISPVDRSERCELCGTTFSDPIQPDEADVYEGAKKVFYRTMAHQFHESYERLAPDFNYKTRPDTKKFNAESPNGRLMIAVVREVVEPSIRRLDDTNIRLSAEVTELKAEIERLKGERYEIHEKATNVVESFAFEHGVSTCCFEGCEVCSFVEHARQALSEK